MYCAHCHNEEKQSGKQVIDTYTKMEGAEFDTKRGKIMRALAEGRMPLGPDGNPAPLDPQTQCRILMELSK
jgi:hypothetical protein